MPKNRKVSTRGHSDSRVLKKQELKESPGTQALSSHGQNVDKGNVGTVKPQKTRQLARSPRPEAHQSFGVRLQLDLNSNAYSFGVILACSQSQFCSSYKTGVPSQCHNVEKKRAPHSAWHIDMLSLWGPLCVLSLSSWRLFGGSTRHQLTVEHLPQHTVFLLFKGEEMWKTLHSGCFLGSLVGCFDFIARLFVNILGNVFVLHQDGIRNDILKFSIFVMGTDSGRANNSFTCIFRAGIFCELTRRIMCQPLQRACLSLFNSQVP